MALPTRWVTDTSEGHSQWYIERFRRMAAEGVDLGGEARPGSSPTWPIWTWLPQASRRRSTLPW
jgi:hypothetical protein